MRLLLQNISAEARAELDLRGVNFDALTASQPTYAEAYLDRSEAQFRLGKTDLARADVEAVLKTDPENVDARFDLGQLKLSTGDAAGARADFNAILDQHPEVANVIAKRADAYSALDDYAAAAKDVAHFLCAWSRRAPQLTDPSSPTAAFGPASTRRRPRSSTPLLPIQRRSAPPSS